MMRINKLEQQEKTHQNSWYKILMGSTTLVMFTLLTPLQSIAQRLPNSNSSPTVNPPPPPSQPSVVTQPTKIPPVNNLNLPQTGNEVKLNQLKSISLSEAIDIALANNREIQAAKLQIESSKEGVREAQAGESIRANIQGTLRQDGNSLLLNNNNPFTPNSSTGLQGTIGAEYDLYNGGRFASLTQAAREQVKFNELNLDITANRLRSDVANAYYELQQADALVIINKAAVTSASRSLRDAQLQEEAGIGTKFDVLRSTVQLKTAEQDLTRSLGDQKNARRRLAQLLSLGENIDLTAKDSAEKRVADWNLSLEDSIVIAYKNRPELAQEIVRRTAAEQQEKAASAAGNSQVSLFAQYQLDKTLSTGTPFNDGYSVGARVRWDFLDGGSSNARSAQQRYTQEVAEANFINRKTQIRLQVEQAYNNLQTNRQNIETANVAVEQAEESLKLARLRFQAGVGTQTDVIDADSKLTQAKGQRIRAIVGYNQSLISLRIAVYNRENP